jgi:hypothetical protein
MYSPNAGRDMNALNAVLLPMLIKARRHKNTPKRIKLFRGSLRAGCTCANVVEKGSPLSREKAHRSRETEAKMLKKEKANIIPSIETKRFVAGLEPVA